MAGATDVGTAFAAIALLVDLLLITSIVVQARERGINPLGWALLAIVLPFVGYALWRASLNATYGGGAHAHDDFQSFMNQGRGRTKPAPAQRRPRPPASDGVRIHDDLGEVPTDDG